MAKSPTHPSACSEALDSPQGWRVVAGVHALTAVTFGSAYAFSAVFPALTAHFDATRAEMALVFSLAAFVFYSLGAVAGPLADRWSPRGLILIGLAAMILGYILVSQARSLAMLYLYYGTGVGIGIGLSYVPALGAVQSWFLRKRSQASGIATAGLGLGTLILPLAVGRAVSLVGWRECFLGLAGVLAVVGVPAACLVRKRVEYRVTTDHPRQGRIGFRHAWQDRRFRRFYGVLLLSSFSTFIPYVHLVPAARDMGLSLESGTMLIGLIGIGNVIGRFVLAGFGDRLGSQRLLIILTLAVAASFGIWAVAHSMAMLALFALAFGMSYGGCVGLYPAVAADLFGAAQIGAVLGYLYTAVGIAALIGPPLAGLIYDRTGSYLVPIGASALAAIVAAFLLDRIHRT
jgi:OFA family oxalate/formate antiporter-like MFS transporter